MHWVPPMPTYLLILGFIVFMSVLIAGYFYLEWAKARDLSAHRDHD